MAINITKGEKTRYFCFLMKEHEPFYSFVKIIKLESDQGGIIWTTACLRVYNIFKKILTVAKPAG